LELKPAPAILSHGQLMKRRGTDTPFKHACPPFVEIAVPEQGRFVD